MTILNPQAAGLDKKRLYVWLATWFGCGLIRKAPGTWGSLGAMPFAALLLFTGGKFALLIGVLAVSLAGLWASGHFEREIGSHDSKMIVIDEVAGMWLTLLVGGLNPLSFFCGFLLFRFFDILKPWPISWLDRNVDGAAGVMADDILAGFFAALCLKGLIVYAGLG